METKVCKTCNIERDINDFQKLKIAKGKYTVQRKECRICRNAYSLKYANTKYKKDPIYREKVLAQSKKWKETSNYFIINKEKFKIRNKLYYINNKEKCALKNAIYREYCTKNLTNRYIKDILTHSTLIKRKDIPQELIELQRKKLKLYRDIKQTKNEKNNKN